MRFSVVDGLLIFFSSERMVYWTLKYHKIDFLTLIDRPFSWRKKTFTNELNCLVRRNAGENSNEFKFTFLTTYFLYVYFWIIFVICINLLSLLAKFWYFLWLSWGGWFWRECFMKNVCHISYDFVVSSA